MNQTNTATRREIKQRCTRRRTTQYNAALKRRNHDKNTRKNLIYVKITYLDRKKGTKDVEG